MSYVYRTHYRPNPCGRVGNKSKLTDDKEEVNCMWCRAMNRIFPILVEVKE